MTLRYIFAALQGHLTVFDIAHICSQEPLNRRARCWTDGLSEYQKNDAPGAQPMYPDAAGGAADNVDKGLGATFEVCQSASGHTSGAVQNQDDIGGVGHDIRSGGQRQFHLKRTVAIDTCCAEFFIGIGDSHWNVSFLSPVVCVDSGHTMPPEVDWFARRFKRGWEDFLLSVCFWI